MVHRNNSFPADSSSVGGVVSTAVPEKTTNKMPHSMSRRKTKTVAASAADEAVVMHYHKHNLKHRFEILKTLGEGTYGKVKLAVDKTTGEKVAIKYIRKHKIQTEQDLIRIQREIKIMASLRHPHIVNITEVFENKEKIILVMEYAAGGELYDYINEKKVLHETEARKFFRQIVSAIHHCHQNGIVHRDLKLENIVLDKDGNIKIADFGLSNMYSYDSLLSTYCGSPLYASPEIVNGTPYHGPEVDCWSLGVLLYTLVYGAMPFDGSDFKRLRRQITEGDFYEPSRPSDASSLIKNLLQVSPKKRAKIADISHHWWVNVGYNYPATSEGLEQPQLLPPLVYSSFHSHSSDSDESETLAPKPSSRKSHRSPQGDQTSCDKTRKEKLSVSVTDSAVEVIECSGTKSPIPFDSNRKPKRGILKNRNSNKSSDSGCVLEDQSSEEKTGTFDLTDLETALDSPVKHSCDIVSSEHDCDKSKLDIKLESNQDVNESVSKQAADINSPTCSPSVTENIENGETKPVVRRRGILKKRARYSGDFDPTNRYSCGSISSNSSGDILDFSYDSIDGEHLFSYGFSANVDDMDANQLSPAVSPDSISRLDNSNLNTNSHLDSNLDNELRHFEQVLNDLEKSSPTGFCDPIIPLDEAKSLYEQALSICEQ